MQVQQRSLRTAMITLILASSACASAPPAPTPIADQPIAPAADPEPLPAGLRLPTDVHPLGYHVDLTVIPGEARFGGTVDIRLRLDRPRRTIWLNAQDLHVTAATLGGRPATWSTPTDPGHAEQGHGQPFGPSAGGLASVTLDAGQAVPAGETTLRVTFDAVMSHGGDSVFDVSEDGRHYVLTTFEPISARKALPCFDEPGFKVPFDLTLTVPSDMVALANTPEVESTPLAANRKRVRFARSEPLPTYLFSFAVGPFDIVTAPALPANAQRSTPLPIRGIALHGKGDRLRDQLAQVGPLVTALEAWFASPYPYAKLDVVAVPSYPGAMENAALILFDEWLMMVDRAHAPLDEQRDATGTLAHELSHQWFGNLVTMAWWDDLWLNEAFATWFANRMVDQVRPELGAETRRLGEWRRAMEADAKASARRIRQPIVHQHDMFSAFDAITYAKGASIIAMFEHWVGAAAWQAGVRAYLRAHAYGNATTDDLLGEVSRAVGRDIGPQFRSFLDSAGAPLVTITVGTPAAGHLPVSFAVERWRPVGSAAPVTGEWQVPVCLAAAGMADTCVLVDKPLQEVDLPFNGTTLGALVPNAGGVGYYRVIVRPEPLLRAALRKPRSAAEAATLVASYHAGFNSGTLRAEAVLDALAPLGASTEPELVRAALAVFAQIGDDFAEGVTTPAFEKRTRALFAKTATRLGWAPKAANETTDVRLLRGEVLAFLAHTARDPRIRREAARRGREVIGDGNVRREVVTPELLATVLAVAIEDGTPELFAVAMKALHASDDPALRRDLMQALAATHDPALAEQVRALVLDPRLTETEMFTPLVVQLVDRETRRATFAWFETHFDAVVARIPPFESGYLPMLANPFCSAEERAAAERVFAPRVASLPGAPQALAETLETIDLCQAVVTAQRAGVRRWLGVSAR